MRSDEETTGLLGARRGNTDYDSFCESVEDVFEASIMLGQTPFVGYSVVQFDLEHPPEPALDNAYLNGEGEAPDFYIALCGSSDALASLNQEDMTIVQLPATRFVKDNDGMRGELQRRAERRAEALQSELSSLRRKEQDAETAKLETELEQRDAWIRQLEARAESADARADDAQAQVDELEQELDDALTALENTRQDADAAISARDLAQKELQELLDKRAREPSAGLSAEDFEDLKEELADTVLLLNKRTAELSDKGKQLSELKLKLKDSARHQEEAEHVSVGRDALEVELSSLDGRARKLEAALSDKSRQMERLERRLVEQEKELDDLHDQLSETEDMLSKARLELEEHAGHRTEELERDVRGFEQQLSDRGHRIIELEGQLRKLEAYAKTLKLELEASAPARPSNGDSTVPNSDEVDKLAQALAEREADLLEAQWKIGQLTQTAVRE
jgi:chromosome segregation ATPase